MANLTAQEPDADEASRLIIDAHDRVQVVETVSTLGLRERRRRAEYVLAMGSCASFGGIPAAPPNPSESTGLQYTNIQPGGLLEPEWRSAAGMPVINLSACPVDAATMIDTMRSIVDGRDLELDRFGRPSTQKPCLSDPHERRCRTADKVGYACYGCVGPKFPLSKPLFRHRERTRFSELRDAA